MKRPTIEELRNKLSKEELLKNFVKIYQQEPTIMSQLPIRLENGSIIKEFFLQCEGCGQTIEDKNLHGTVTRLIDNKSINFWTTSQGKNQQGLLDGILFDGIGYCPNCNMLTPCHNRATAQDGMMLESIQNNQWVKGIKEKSWLEKIKFWK